MPTKPQLATELRELYAKEFARLQQNFHATTDGRAAVLGRTALVESVALRLWNELISPEADSPRDFALVALGGFGRGVLFPYSDVDLLFLHAGDASEGELKVRIRSFSQELWDLRLKLSPATRTLAECDRFDPDNLEFTISLLDCRYLAGDRALFAQLHDTIVRRLVLRDAPLIIKHLADLTRSRHAKFGHTVFHLEPNVKDSPGGLRDYNVACWLALISAMDSLRAWPDEKTPLPISVREPFEAALGFLMAVRCFLHFRHARDDNSLAWDAEEEAAKLKIGASHAAELTPSDWMRIYFSHARKIHRVCTQLLEELPSTRPSLYRQFQSLRSRLSNAEFSVVGNLVFVRQPEALGDPHLLLRAFRFLARHGLIPSSTTESQIEQVLPSVAADPPRGSELWHLLQEILLGPHAADALRSMHALRLLTLLLPELQAIDALVIRDYSHRFTVDEHTFVAIENLHALRQSQSKWDQRYAELLEELEQPDLLYLSILLHDTGKGTKTDNHVGASVLIAADALDRLDLDPPDRETVLFLIGSHLDMSAALRRDIFDPQTIRAFAEKVGTPERLKMLCLLTYADIKAVNPDALTPWKAENIWQLYIATSNFLNRTLDDRVHADAHDEVVTHLRTLAPAAGKGLESFLVGLPRRYLLTHPAGEVLGHLEMAVQLGKDPVQLGLRRGRHWFELTLVTTDRPHLFATMAGVLAAWGMNIVKAAAFSNQAGIVVDTFYFTDRFHTLELNLPEWDRFKTNIHDVLLGKADLAKMLRDRLRSEKHRPLKVKVKTRIEFDDDCSAHSTLVEVIAQDQPGLLHRISSKFSQENCNIEIALIETEGQTAIDVFYLTSAGSKLTAEHQARLRASLIADLES
ncbi:MAG: [protein-PII] uridylyltransferase [Candidatus Acidiferrales bacterium]